MADSSYTAEQLAAAQAEDVEKYPARYAMGGYIYDRLVKEDMAKNAKPSASSEDFMRRRDEFEAGMTELKKPIVQTTAVETYPTGAVRDTPEGKPRYDLIDPLLLRRVAAHLQLGAEYYGEHNWTKGIPSSRYMASLLRHVEQHRNGERDEDHLAAAVFNIMGLMRNEERHPELNDLYDWNGDVS